MASRSRSTARASTSSASKLALISVVSSALGASPGTTISSLSASGREIDLETVDAADLETSPAGWWPDLRARAHWYSPAGRSRRMYSPFSSLTVVRSPWSAGDVAVTVTPGSGSPSCVVTLPVRSPWCAPAPTPRMRRGRAEDRDAGLCCACSFSLGGLGGAASRMVPRRSATRVPKRSVTPSCSRPRAPSQRGRVLVHLSAG